MIGNQTSIQDILDQGGSVMIQITAEDLKKVISDTVNASKRAMQADIAKSSSETLLTVKEVTERLSIDRSTLWLWGKKNYLCPIKIGGKVRYKLSDVNEILNRASV